MARDDLDERLEDLKRESAGDGAADGVERWDDESDDLDAAVVDDLRSATGDESDPEAAEAAFLTGAAEWGGSESHLLSFYDRLRRRITDAVERRGGRLGPAVTRTLLVAPDIFMLMVRLTLDRDVPASTRAMIGGALAYFVLPVDLLPEAVIGAGGYLDDLVLASAVLAHTFSRDLEPYASRHWSGQEDLRKVLADVADAGQGLLGRSLYDRIQKLLRRRGIQVDEAGPEG